MNNRKYILKSLVLGVFVLLLLSCAKERIIDLPEESPKLVVLANAIEGELLNVYISYSAPVYAIDTSSINQKRSVVLEYENLPGEELQPKTADNGVIYYQSKTRMISGDTYTLSVSQPGFEPVSGSTTVPHASEVYNIVLNPASFTTSAVDSVTSVLRVPMNIKLANLPETDSLFAFRLKYERVLNNGDITENKATFLAAGAVLANIHESPDLIFIVNKKHWKNNTNATLSIDVLMPFIATKTDHIEIILDWHTLSPEYYKYHISLSRQGDYTLPFSTPDVVYNNIINGYGNFSAYKKKEIRVPVF